MLLFNVFLLGKQKENKQISFWKNKKVKSVEKNCEKIF